MTQEVTLLLIILAIYRNYLVKYMGNFYLHNFKVIKVSAITILCIIIQLPD